MLRLSWTEFFFSLQKTKVCGWTAFSTAVLLLRHWMGGRRQLCVDGQGRDRFSETLQKEKESDLDKVKWEYNSFLVAFSTSNSGVFEPIVHLLCFTFFFFFHMFACFLLSKTGWYSNGSDCRGNQSGWSCYSCWSGKPWVWYQGRKLWFLRIIPKKATCCWYIDTR